MSRYIDADALIDTLGVSDEDINFREVLDEAPSIDIVRCGECKYWRNKDPQQIPTASIMCGHMHPDDFCSYGEREGE